MYVHSKLETLGLQVKIYWYSFFSKNKLCKQIFILNAINSYDSVN